jgi:outer membrane lipoprotein-sorting protein
MRLAGMLAAAALAATNAWGAFTIEALMTELAANAAGTVRFNETRSSPILKQPIETSGTMTFTPPARLERRTLKPRAERFVVDGDTLTVDTNGDKRTLRLADFPALRASIESLRATLSGDLATLRRYYRVELGGTESQWQLLLLPREPEMAELVRSIRIDGMRSRIVRVEVFEASGDRTVTTLSKDGS